MGRLKGYVLSADGKDIDNKHYINLYCAGDEVNFKIEINDFSPVFFIEKNVNIPFSKPTIIRKPVALKTFQEKEVDALYFKTQSDLNLAKDLFISNGIRTYESDVRSPERFLMEHFINGEIEIDGEPISENDLTVFKNPKIKGSDFRPQFKIISLDIETGMDGRLFSIACVQRYRSIEKKKIFMVGLQEDKPEKNLSFFSTEKELLESFLIDFHKWDPDILIGWHVIGFDLQFLEKKFIEHKVPFNLGRDKSKPFIYEKKNAGWLALITGRVVIDGPAALKNNFYKFENYKLDTVAQKVLGVGKDINEKNNNKVQEIERRFNEDKESLAEYNLLDCILVLNIFEKLSLIDLIFQRAKISGLQLDKVGISTLAFDHYFLPRIHREGYVSSNIIDIQREGKSEGGYVLEPKSGIHDYVVVLDFKSLYPSIISTFKIDPYSRIKSHEEPLETPVGIKFSHKKHILPDLINDLLEKRNDAKLRGNNNLSQAIKILMNSFYGVMGSTGSRFYHADLPSAITGTGQWVIKESIKFLESRGYQVLYGDTDSIFVLLKDSEKKHYGEAGNEMVKEINSFLTTKIYREFKINSSIEIKYEKTYRKLFLPFSRDGVSGAKKRYAGLIIKDGKEELNVVGMEYIRSDWTDLAKKFQSELFLKVFKDENIDDWIKKFINRIKEKEFDKDLIYRKKLSKNPEEYTKAIPPHVKAAMLLGHSLDNPLREVSYVMTTRGPIPIERDHKDVDYNHYIEKQIKPLADSVLFLKGKSFEDLVMGDQLSLF
jgi:DNA polymerase II